MPPTTGYFLFIYYKKTFEVDASPNANTLTETIIGNAKIKTKDMKNDARDDATD